MLRRARFEGLENRALLTTFAVNQIYDAVDLTPAGDGVADAAPITPGNQTTLRAAIQEANATPGPHTILLPSGHFTLSLQGLDEDASAAGDLDVKTDLTILGAGAADTVIDAAGIDRVFHVFAGHALRLSGVAVTGGYSHLNQSGYVRDGGGFYNSGNLDLTDCVVTGNAAGSNSSFGSGGAIYNAGFNSSLTITRTTISNNTAANPNGNGSAGGIANLGSNSTVTIVDSTLTNNSAQGIGGAIYSKFGSVTIQRSTLSGNSAGVGGGGIQNQASLSVADSTFANNSRTAISNSGTLTVTGSTFHGNSGASGSAINNSIATGGALTLTNSTFSGNQASGNGATISCVIGTATITNVTVAGNTAAASFGATGGISGNSNVTIKNSIVAGNSGTADPDVVGTFTSQGHNLIGNVGSASGFANGTNGDQVGGGANPVIDPLLGPLQDNGGRTFTRAALAGSPALDAGDNAGAPAADQRGISRPQNGVVDIGAYERFTGVASAGDDSYVLGSTSGPSRASTGVLANDSNAGGFNAALVSGPAHGSVSLNADGSFTYTAGAGFAGVDQFVYRAQLGAESATNAATVSLVSHDAALVRKLYNQVLHRDPELSGWQYWTQRIGSGAGTLGEIASGIFESNERLDPIIRQMYRDFLFREADDSGLAFWREGVWKRDGEPDNVIAGIISSPEFFRSAGGTNAAWTTELYRRLLGRDPDSQGLAYWTVQLDSGAMSRPQVVLGFVRSTENFHLLVRGWYSQYLGRSPSASEENAWVGQLQHGASQRSVQIQLLNSPEYRTTPTQPAAGTAQPI